MIEQRSHRLPEFAEWLEETRDQTLTVSRPPKRQRVRLHTTNPVKLRREVARRTRWYGFAPSRKSRLRLITAPAMEQSADWLAGPDVSR